MTLPTKAAAQSRDRMLTYQFFSNELMLSLFRYCFVARDDYIAANSALIAHLAFFFCVACQAIAPFNVIFFAL